MAVQRWRLDDGGTYQYDFTRNPDRNGGDTGWEYPLRYEELSVVGSDLPTIHVGGLKGARRRIKFSALDGTMKRTLEAFYKRKLIVSSCWDHLGTTHGPNWQFDIFITSFRASFRPSLSSEDLWDVEMEMIRMD